MSTTNELTSAHAAELRLAAQEGQLRDTQRELEQVRRELDALRAAVERLTARSVATCKKCGTTYDMFSHHYSIGLFDNIVYVKCPACQTPMPVDPRLGVRAE
ncbi:MAG: hypothetical protein ACOYXR_13740 [Nitrospirota bacterium]